VVFLNMQTQNKTYVNTRSISKENTFNVFWKIVTEVTELNREYKSIDKQKLLLSKVSKYLSK